jgi:ADP-ribose pyrophosphatase
MDKKIELLADQPADVEVSEPKLLAHAYRDYERYQLVLHREGESSLRQERDVIRAGDVVGVLVVDVERDEVVLIRQFRLAAHLATGNGDMMEIVAGRVDPGEEPRAAARRECLEESGLRPRTLTEIYDMLPTPGLTDERIILFIAMVDVEKLPTRAGLAHEDEDTRPMRVSIDDALEALRLGQFKNALTITALQWLQINRGSVIDMAPHLARDDA